jgi:carbonic anhydrase/acetyltransferase-like protein (isoleucine patch superfamily)
MTLIEFQGTKLKISSGAYVSPTATLIGDVEVGEGSSIWENAVLRGDMGPIRVARHRSIQDNCTIHIEIGGQCVVGDFVTVGHNAVVHGSMAHDCVVAGMNSTLLEGSEIGLNSVVAAGSVVLEKEKTPPKVFWQVCQRNLLGTSTLGTLPLSNRRLKPTLNLSSSTEGSLETSHTTLC